MEIVHPVKWHSVHRAKCGNADGTRDAYVIIGSKRGEKKTTKSNVNKNELGRIVRRIIGDEFDAISMCLIFNLFAFLSDAKWCR